MRNHLIFLILSLVLFACNKSYDTSANIEANIKPTLNTNNTDPETFIDRSLKLMYPNIGRYDLKEEDSRYAISFKIGGNHFKVKFDANGDWVNSQIGIRFKNRIPGKIRSSIESSQYSGWFMTDKTLIETPAYKNYKIEFQKGEEEWDVYYDINGEILRKDKEIKKTKNIQ